MFDRKHGRDPSAMRLEFAIVEGEERRYDGTLLLRPAQSQASFTRNEGPGQIRVLHQFRLPTASMTIHFDEPRGDHGGKAVVETAFAIGVHQSVEWEAISLGEQYVFWFRCTPLFRPGDV